MKNKVVTLAFALATLLFTLTGPAAANVTAYVVHGIDGDDFGLDPELPVDVWVSELGCVLPGFEFGSRVGPLTVPAGDYDIMIRLADEMPCSGTEVISLAGVNLPDGASATIIAHRTVDGEPGAGDQLGLGVTASLFANDSSPTERGKARIIAHHTALAPAVDVVVSRDYSDPNAPGVTVPGFSNPTSVGAAVLSQVNAQFRPGDVALELDGAAVFGPTGIRVKPFSTTYIYAVGDFFSGTFQYLVFTDSGKRVGGARASARVPRALRN